MDYKEWFLKNGGLVVGGSIDKRCYISARYLPPFHEYKTRVVYSAIETVKHNLDIQHRAIKATIEHLGMQDASLEIFHSSDLPGRSGTGSSSSFVVGLAHALACLKGTLKLPAELMEDAIYIEQKRMGEAVGCQDQAFAAHGGVNIIKFRKGGDISVQVLPINIKDLEAHLLLIFTGINRTASDIAKTYVGSLGERGQEQWAMMSLAEQGIESLYKSDYEKLGKLIDKSWRIKAGLSPQVTTPLINEAYITARVNGAWGGKLIGAGGGGCILLVAPPEKHSSILTALPSQFVNIPFHFDHDGSVVIFANREVTN